MASKIQQRAFLSLVVAALACATALYAWQVIAPPSELAVYEALLTHWADDVAESPLALMSRPTTCGIEEAHQKILDEELILALYRANAPDQSPIQIGSLSRFMDVVSYESSKRLRTVGNLANAQGVEVAYLSRVGFSKDGSSALICFEGVRSGVAVVFVRESNWTVKEEHLIWVS